MNLKDFLADRDNPPELYWSLVIEEDWVQAGIWYIGESAAEVVSVSPGAAWESDDELVGATDAALSSAVQMLPENYKEPDKTVFGVCSSWVKEGEIAEEYLAKIKKLCTELSLTPVGFVVLPEAIAHLYKSEEGAPMSSIVLGLGRESLEISVFKMGNLVGTTQVSRSVSLIDDMTEGLSRFEGAVPLPSRFIVYNGKEGELEEAKQSLIQASWDNMEKIKFLHTPKAEILSPDRKVLSVSLAGAAEIGNVSQVRSMESTPEEVSPIQEEKERIDNEPLTKESSAEELGFSVGEDVSSLGSEVQNVIPVMPEPISHPMSSNYIQKTKDVLHSFSSKIFSPKSFNNQISQPKSEGNGIWIALGVFVLALVAAGIFWWFFPKAKITVFVTPKRFEQTVQVSFSPNGTFDIGSGIIPAQVITDQVSGDKTKATSGTKLIGNKAAGSVQIANGNGSPINLASGTVLISSGGLRFVTDSEASISGQLLPGSPGTANVNVTAGDIGSQYNLAKGEVFSVGNYSRSLVAATSTADFSGGSSQEIAAVSTDDQTSLENDLKNELSQNAINDITGKVAPDQIFVNSLATTNITNQAFDHKIGDQADSLKLSLSLTTTGIAADKSKLLQYAQSVLKGKSPPGYNLPGDQVDYKFTFVSQQGGNYVYSVTIGANFLPQVDNNLIINNISGKTVTVAKNYLNSIPGFDHANVSINPHFPGPFGTLPRVSKNISIDITSE